MLLFFANLLSVVTPQTRLFWLRNRLYLLAGVGVSSKSKICGTTRIHYANASIGEETWVGAHTDIIPTKKSRVEIGDRCDIGPGVMFVTGSHEFGDGHRRAGQGKSAPIRLGDGTWVGARVTFLAGAEVGSGCMIAAGSVVKGVFPSNSLVAGVPARIIRTFSDS